MVTNQEILAWVQYLPDTNELSPAQSPPKLSTEPPALFRKRRATQGPRPPATVSDMEGPETSTRKRQRLEAKDLGLTPRPQPEPSKDPSKAPSLTCSNTSGHSRSTSPLKRHLLALRLDEQGLDTKELSVDALEALPNHEAVSLLRIMHRIGTCKGILPDDQRDKILQSHEISEDDEDWNSAFRTSTMLAGLPGCLPELEEINLIRQWSKEFVDLDDQEAGWNDEVYFRLLQAVFRKPGKKTGGLFNVCTSNSARPHKAWLPKSVGFKMVDFCIYADTAQQDDVSPTKLSVDPP
ncbi:uncharacterized protein FRV6_11699 [Fusarium oxysporum]|uniref:PD-(D/E)XK nuclease-like domain-containing protein n=1 Tax=Fusarium oxysporum TaxID=5507 RepID=A0A2H3TFY8_FUSOX|nr:uncharacterized protein FRV6_11699 [Fusarium oxysporum]